MANENIWAKRVEAWRKSGLTSVAFAEGKGFTGGGLRHMAYRLGKAAAKPPVIRLARVVRARAPAVASASAAIVVVVGMARIEVQPGVSREALTTVFEALADRSRE
ncbi:MAG: IS66 family insertion sequence element accessory protein TnpA [Myxococcaceae bacterium]